MKFGFLININEIIEYVNKNNDFYCVLFEKKVFEYVVVKDVLCIFESCRKREMKVFRIFIFKIIKFLLMFFRV